MRLIERNDELMLLKLNNKKYYSLYSTSTPLLFTEWLLKKEDKYFYYHPGINPMSLISATLDKFGLIKRRGSSTITQQLVKILLGNEVKRSAKNKITELIYALALDFLKTKKTILAWYLNSSYFGNQLQGLETASLAYFKTPADKLSNEQVLQLLATLSNPSYQNPTSDTNISLAQNLAKQFKVEVSEANFIEPKIVNLNLKKFLNWDEAFEMAEYLKNIETGNYQLTIDLKLTRQIREIVRSTMPSFYDRDAHNAAVVVLKAKTNEVLAIVGTPDPKSKLYGQQINMALEPRQIASTVKPFIYLKAFEGGMRGDTLIDDSQYEFRTADGRQLNLKNYDNKYHGMVTAGYALSNSINIPSVKTLEQIGLDNFKDFLTKLNYSNLEKVEEHQLGVALGTLPFSLLELTHDYSIFPRGGNYSSLKLFTNQKINDRIFPKIDRQVIDKKFVEMITDILSDRRIATDQFGYVSNLSLPIANYALKTGTSDDYRDSWVIGYTPDFVVGTWVGNANNESTKKLSGQTGAGEIWSRVMELMVSYEDSI